MSVWGYYSAVLSLAGRETFGTFGLTKAGIIAGAFCLGLGALLHRRFRGWPKAKDELLVFAMYSLAPYALMLCVVFGYNFVIAPYTLYTHSQQEASNAKADKGDIEDRYTKEISDLEKKLNDATKPEFVLETSDALCIGGARTTSALLSMRIANRGADSAVFDYRITYNSPRVSETGRVVHLSQPFSVPIGEGRISVTPSSTLDHLAARPIPRGGYTDGRLALEIPGQHCQDITDGVGVITIEVQDYLGTSYSVDFRGTGSTTAVKRLFGEPFE